MAQMNIDPTSALYWLPKLKEESQLRVPSTIFVPCDYQEMWKMLDGEAAEYGLDALLTAGKLLGYPVFLRTDLSSAKHEGPDAYKVSGPDHWPSRVWRTIEDNAMKDLWPSAFLVREWLDLEAPFVAFGGHPIANEWRVFASGDRVHCYHFYWPEEAISYFPSEEPEHWQEQLRRMSEALMPFSLLEMARMAASLCPESKAWSVDFAKDKQGLWWLIDMAEAKASRHPNDCPNVSMLKGV